MVIFLQIIGETCDSSSPKNLGISLLGWNGVLCCMAMFCNCCYKEFGGLYVTFENPAATLSETISTASQISICLYLGQQTGKTSMYSTCQTYL